MTLALRKCRKQPGKTDRIEAHLNPEQERRIEHAAGLKGTSVSEFMVLSADDAAMQTIRQHEVWKLTGQDRVTVVDALLRPPAPSAHMNAAVRRYRHQVRHS